MHENLALSESQHAALTSVEEAYATKRIALRNSIRDANEKLAETLRNSPTFTDGIKGNLATLSAAQSELQAATLEHFFAMKQSLNPAQQEKLLQWTHDSLLHH